MAIFINRNFAVQLYNVKYVLQAGELPDDVDWAFVFRVDPDGNVSRVYSTIPERRFVDLPGLPESPIKPSGHSNCSHGNHFETNVSGFFLTANRTCGPLSLKLLLFSLVLCPGNVITTLVMHICFVWGI